MLALAILLLLGLTILLGSGWLPLGDSRTLAPEGKAGYYRLQSGTQIVHCIKYRSEGATDFRAVFGSQNDQTKGNRKAPALSQKFSSEASGDRRITIIEWKDGAWLAAVHMENFEILYAVNDQRNSVQEQVLRSEISQDLFVRITPEGKILSLRFPPSSGNFSKGYVQTLLGLTQFVFPENEIPADGRWEVEEENTGGQSIALYERLVSDSSLSKPKKTVGKTESFRKTRLRYLPHARKKVPGQSVPEQRTVPKGSLVAQFQIQEGNLLCLTGNETNEFYLGDKRVGSAENSVTLEFFQRLSIPSSEIAELKSRFSALEGISQDITLSTNVSRESANLSIERNALGQATSESLLEDLKVANKSSEFDRELVRKLEALFRLYPDTCASFGRSLTTADPDSRSFQYISSALAVTANANAQEALIEVIRSRQGEVSAMARLLPALAYISEPIPPMVKVVTEIASEGQNEEQIIQVSWYALGVMAQRLGQEHPERAEQIVKFLIREMEKSPSESKTTAILSALGNSASVKALPVILKCLNDASVIIRAAAVSSLRLIEAPEVEPAILRALTADLQESVRQQAATVLASKEMTQAAFNAQASAVLRDTAPMVRTTILRTLAKAIDQYPQARSVIRQVAEGDSLEAIRKVAKEILDSNPGNKKAKK
jgi:hypothetical protein